MQKLMMLVMLVVLSSGSIATHPRNLYAADLLFKMGLASTYADKCKPFLHWSRYQENVLSWNKRHDHGDDGALEKEKLFVLGSNVVNSLNCAESRDILETIAVMGNWDSDYYSPTAKQISLYDYYFSTKRFL
jgi:hypothetical protein